MSTFSRCYSSVIRSLAHAAPRSFLFIFAICCVIGTPATAYTQEQAAEVQAVDAVENPFGGRMRDDAPDGETPVDKLSETLGDLIHLVEANKQLGIQRDFVIRAERAEANENPEERRKELIDKYLDRGMDIEMATDRVDDELEREARWGGRRGAGDNFLTSQLAELSTSMGLGSRGYSGGQLGRMSYRATGDGCRFGFITSDELVDISFSETGGDTRMWRLSDCGDETLVFRFTSDQQLIEYRQRAGRARLAVIDDDEAIVFLGDNFLDLKTKHAEEMNNYFFPLLKQMGLKRPLSFKKFNVRKSAIEALQATESDEQMVITLLDELESDSFSARDAAQAELMDGYWKWNALIKELSSDRDYGEEAAKRFEKVIKGSPATMVQDFLHCRDLLDSPETLVELYEYLEEGERSVVVARLEKITGQKFGDDIVSWQDWVNR